MLTNIKMRASKDPKSPKQGGALGQGPKMSSKAVCFYCVVSKINFIKQCRGSKGSLLSKKQEHEVKVMRKVRKNVKKT
jgi:hypothetical protein